MIIKMLNNTNNNFLGYITKISHNEDKKKFYFVVYDEAFKLIEVAIIYPSNKNNYLF